MADRAPQHTVFAKRLDALTDEQLHNAAKQVAATMLTPGWEFIVQLIGDARQDALEEMVGGVREHADYVRASAKVRGMDVALSAGPTVLHIAERRRQRESELREVA